MRPNANSGDVAGRFCPIDYTLSGDQFQRSLTDPSAEVVYVVGGLYGNTEALSVILEAFNAERAAAKHIVFNGDFHWFDSDVNEFAAVEKDTALGICLRGNVETEIARSILAEQPDVGCGCAYPPEVSDLEVAYSNQIIQRLRQSYSECRAAGLARPLQELAMTMRINVGEFCVGITHGDDQSLAGWGLSHDRIASTFSNGLQQRMIADGLDVIASSHTCLPVLFRSGQQVIVNNGSAGMANFVDSTSGVLTRICLTGSAASKLPSMYRTEVIDTRGGLVVEALEIPFRLDAWQAKFLSQWPPGSAANASYWKRLSSGTSYSRETALQYEL
jgi:predicted phosphodiesterase